jgi:SAM-dependent methyltransferase
MPFDSYSKYYDLFYKDKDYEGESEYIHQLIQKYVPGSKSILDLGCGTGAHALFLAKKGYQVYGVDRSKTMLAKARERLRDLDSMIGKRLSFSIGDVRSIRLGRKFDVVISLFHVMSYQTTNDDLRKAFATARVHLKNRGLFVFDCWYGPGVLTDRPAVRIKRYEDGSAEVTRVAEPQMHANSNTVDVIYHIFAKGKRKSDIEEIKEVHSVRYLFEPEIVLLLNEAGLKLIKGEEWMSGKELGFTTWNACYWGTK